MSKNPRTSSHAAEAGFALILALLCLMVLTMLGMTLATTSSTELQIATNHRWSQQALYNAEAGIEVGKRYLEQYPWHTLVPLAREATPSCSNTPPDAGCPMHNPPTWDLARPGQNGDPNRNWEADYCDTTYERGHIGYGNVFDHASFDTPLQNTTSLWGFTLNGTFTLWVRRALESKDVGGGEYHWEESETALILTAEGTAPYVGGANIENSAVRFIQAEVRRVEDCGEDYGDGGGPSGSNFDRCSELGPGGAFGGDESGNELAQ